MTERAPGVIDRDFERQLEGYGLTTARILYRLPDHPAILQTYVWQDYDVAPDYPELGKFITFWRDSLEGRLHSVEVAHRRLIGPSEWKRVDGLLQIH
jgi:uncharacterized protein Usg